MYSLTVIQKLYVSRNTRLLLSRDEDIDTNDDSVNKNKDTLRPGNDDSPATSNIANFTVSIRFPEYGVVVNRIRLPERDNINGVLVFVYRFGKDDPRPLNNAKVCKYNWLLLFKILY